MAVFNEVCAFDAGSFFVMPQPPIYIQTFRKTGPAAMMLTFATTIGFCGEQSASDVTMLSATDRQCIGKKIEEDDPFCLMVAFPCELQDLITPLHVRNADGGHTFQNTHSMECVL